MLRCLKTDSVHVLKQSYTSEFLGKKISYLEFLDTKYVNCITNILEEL